MTGEISGAIECPPYDETLQASDEITSRSEATFGTPLTVVGNSVYSQSSILWESEKRSKCGSTCNHTRKPVLPYLKFRPYQHNLAWITVRTECILLY